MNKQVYLYPQVFAHTITKEMVDDFLIWAVSLGASDIVFRAFDPPWIQVDGEWHAVSERFSIAQSETQLLTNLFSGQEHKAGNVQRGMSADFAYAIPIPNRRGLFQRFRVNVTSTNAGHYLVLRPLPTAMPTLASVDVPKALYPHLFPGNGLVLISGVMGSGKSTLLAALMHAAICTKEAGGLGIGRHILTLEQPIEFDLTNIPFSHRCAPVAQSEIGLHVQSWAHGVRSMTRRKGEIVMVGEARDRETIEAMLSVAEQGVTCYASVHAMDVPQTITRIVNTFPIEERDAVCALVKANLRLIIHQRLVPANRTDSLENPGRIALREFLVFDESIRLHLYATPYDALIPTVRSYVAKSGQPLLHDVTLQYTKGLLSYETFARIQHEIDSSNM